MLPQHIIDFIGLPVTSTQQQYDFFQHCVLKGVVDNKNYIFGYLLPLDAVVG